MLPGESHEIRPGDPPIGSLAFFKKLANDLGGDFDGGHGNRKDLELKSYLGPWLVSGKNASTSREGRTGGVGPRAVADGEEDRCEAIVTVLGNRH